LGSSGGGGGQGGSGPGNKPKGCWESLMDGWNRIPFFNQFLVLFCTLLFIAKSIVPAVGASLALCPAFIAQLQVWRLFTGQFLHMDALNLLFSLISYVPSAMQDEQNMGTTAFALRFFVMSTFINTMFSILGLAVGYSGIYDRIMMEPVIGLWAILFCDIVI
jgi:membrane associated rhomboid family serine protease